VKVEEFDYRLPPERIAQHPASQRDQSRLLVLSRATGAVTHSRFDDLRRWLDPGDLLVFNDTRVLPARLIGTKESGGRVELLLLERPHGGPADEQRWHCLLRASRPPSVGSRLHFAAGLQAHVLGREGEGWSVRLETERGGVDETLERVGLMPLPPYIKRPDPGEALSEELAEEDRLRYQTVFARRPGAVAAPTAGLHFTPELLASLDLAGIRGVYVTLHVGPGTFQPVRVERVEDHVIHEEGFAIGEEVAEAIRRTREGGGRIVAVGTTVVRALEHNAASNGEVRPGSGKCDLFIHPGFDFRVVDAILTNFHLPRSTLLMLVSAFAGRERVLAAYEQAIAHGYRFYSYGDAMLVRTPR
jgi:S-adenosylmethionine:tRNA ribosyltransferase-isomerase